jgi:type II secretory pathway predicted ATPase ExeA
LKYKIECEKDELNVTENVRGLLDHIRDPNEDRVIWIDSICIDQQNFEERSQQVRLVRQIYSSAKSVNIWLGPEKDDSGLLEEFIPRLTDVFWRSRRAELFTDEVLFQKRRPTERPQNGWP